MKIKPVIDTTVRLIVAALFMFSGLVKLNDPVGTEIKLEEYFEVFASDFGSFFLVFIPAALEIGLFLIVLEIVLGIALILNYRMEITSRIVLGLILYFTFLTFYSAFFNKVTDCGCFGDAIPLTPWQTFYKDIILMVLIMYLFRYRKVYNPLTSQRVGNIVIASTAVVSLFIGIFAIEHLPYIDFRAYKIGDNIKDNMVPEEQPVFEYTFTKDGNEVKSQKFLLEADGYELVGYEIINEDKTTPKITDYNVWNPDLGDYTEQTFEGIKLMIIIVDAETANTRHIENITKLIEEVGTSIESIVLTSSDPSVFEPFRHQYQLAVPYFFSDATVLKAMIRSNPGTILIRNGTIVGKWHYNDSPSVSELLIALDR